MSRVPLRISGSIRLLGALILLWIFLTPAPASAVTVEFGALLDLDDDAATGCTLSTVDGPFDGVEQLLVTTVETTPSPVQVTGVVRHECDAMSGTFGPAIAVDSLQVPPWPVGIGNGTMGSSVVETYFPLEAVGAALPVRIGVVSNDLSGNGDALLDLLVADAPGVPEIPTLSSAALLGLVLLLAVVALWRLRRRGAVAVALLVAGAAVGTVGAVCVLDGQIDDWAGVLPVGTDSVADAPVDVDLLAAFAREDGAHLCLRYDVDINVAPVAVADNFATPEDTPLNVAAPGVLLNDSDVNGDLLTAVLDTAPPMAEVSAFTLDPDGSFDLTPAANFNGATSFTYHANDGALDSNTVTVTVTVGPVPDGPMAVDDDFATDEDTALVIAAPGVLNNDSDPENDPLEVTAFDALSAQGAAVSVAADGGFTYDPTGAANLQALAAGAMLDDTFTYTVEDIPSSGSDVGTVTVTVTGIDDPPTAVNDLATVTEDDPATAIDVLANDTDPDGGVKQITGVTQPANGAVVNNVTDLTYEPDPDYCNDPPGTVTDDFTYTITGGSMATVSVTVTCVNDPPMILGETFDVAAGNFDPAIGNTTLHFANADTVAHPHVFIAGDVLDNDIDTESDPLSVSQVDGDAGAVGSPKALPSGAVVTLEADGELTYSPPLGFEGMDSFTYTVSDGTDSGMATVTVEITEMVWYLDNQVDGTGDDGRSASPFDSIAQFDAQNGGGNADDPEAGDIVFIHEGAGVYDAGAAGVLGLDLLDQQKLWGEGIGLTVLGQTLVPAGNRPQVDNTNANGQGVTVAATTADRTGIEIRGLAISGDEDAIFVGSSTTFATEVTISDNLIDDAGDAGIDLNPGSSGDFTVTVSNNTWSTTSPAGNGLDLTTLVPNTADVILALDGNTDITGGGAGVNVDGTSGGGTVFVTSLSGNTVNGATAADGMRFDTVVFDADPTDADFTGDTVDGGATAIGSLADRVSGSGLVLDTVTGDLSFSDLDVANDGGTGLRVVSAATFSPGGTGFRLTTGAGSTLDTTNGPAVDIDPATLAASFASIFNTNSTTVGISLTDAEGSFSAAGGSIATAGMGSGPTFQVSGGSVMATYGGLVSSAAGNSVQVQNMTGGTVTLSGIVDDDGAGISITGNDNATSVTFSGGLDLDTTTNTAFTATGDGSVTVNASANNNAVDTTTATALLVNGVDLTSAFDSVSVAAGAGVGISLQSSAGTKGLGLVSITNSGGAGLFASNAGTVNVTNAASSIATTGQPAVDADNTTFGATFASLTSDDSASTGLDLASVGGSFTATTVAIDDTTGAGVQLTGNTATVALNGGTIGETTNSATTTGGNALDVDGGTGPVTVAAAITNTAARSVEVTNRTAGAVTVSGALSDTGTGINVAKKVVNTGANAAVTLATNTGHLIQFTGGGLDVDTTSGAGFTATGGGTVEVSGTGNTIDNTTGTALNVTNTDIGAGRLTFQSISSDGGSNPGIVLDTTGVAGGLTVSGAGGDCKNNVVQCSGGSIVNKTGDVDGILLTSTVNVDLSHMNVSGHSRNGIFGTGVIGFRLNQSRFTGNADQAAPDEAAVHFVDSTGSILGGSNQTRFDDLLVSNSHEHNVVIRNNSGTITNLAVNNSIFTNNGASTEAGNNFFVDAGGTANVTVNVTGSQFNGNTTPGTLTAFGLVGDAADTSSVTLNASTSSFSSNNVALSASASNSGDVTFNFSNNPTVTGSRSNAINVFANANHTGTISGRIETNTVGTNGVLSSGSQFGSGVRVSNEGTGTVTALINGNTIQEVGDGNINAFEGIFINETVNGGTTNVTITGNALDQIRDDRGINVQQVNGGGTVCSDVSGNTLTNIGSTTPLRVRQVTGTHNVRQLDPAGPADPNRLDTVNGLTSAEVSVSGTINFNQGACPQP